jgi:ABC-type uncharacterized transport system permease subunit
MSVWTVFSLLNIKCPESQRGVLVNTVIILQVPFLDLLSNYECLGKDSAAVNSDIFLNISIKTWEFDYSAILISTLVVMFSGVCYTQYSHVTPSTHIVSISFHGEELGSGEGIYTYSSSANH